MRPVQVAMVTAAAVVVVVVVILAYPPPDLRVNDSGVPDIVIPIQASEELTLIEIFEESEAGVVRLTVMRNDTLAPSGVGSGFVYDKMGHIITNAHVVQDNISVEVTFPDGRSYEADIVGIDQHTDLAVVMVDTNADLLEPLRVGDSSMMKVGQQVAAIGNPFGLSGSMTSGIISQVDRMLPVEETGFSIPDVIQTDAAINPGNSGGPLLNMMNEVIGVNTAIQSVTGEFSGVGFAVPSQTVLKIVPNLIEEGKYEHPWIGVSGTDINPRLAEIMNLTDTLGFHVISVVEQSPAHKAGLRGSNSTVEYKGVEYLVGGDIILKVDDITVRKISDILLHLQRSKAVGDEMNLQILREGNIIERTLILEQRPDSFEQ